MDVGTKVTVIVGRGLVPVGSVGRVVNTAVIQPNPVWGIEVEETWITVRFHKMDLAFLSDEIATITGTRHQAREFNK